MATTTPSTRFRRIAREAGIYALLLIGMLAARSTLADHYYVPSGSMQPTLLPGDRIVVDKRAYGLRIPFTQVYLGDGSAVRRGEVVIFDSPRDGARLIKRIVAVGGDEVAIRNGHLFINNQPLADGARMDTEVFAGRIVRLDLRHGGGPDYSGVVPDGKLLAVGDHRGNSLDGRMFGLIDESAVYGRAVAVYFRRDDGVVWKAL